MGAVHILELHDSTDAAAATSADDDIEVVRANRVKIYWQIPQIYVIAFGEVLVSVTGLEFAYSQSSPAMKSVLQVGEKSRCYKKNVFVNFLRLFGISPIFWAM